MWLDLGPSEVAYSYVDGPQDAEAAYKRLDDKHQQLWAENGVIFQREESFWGDVTFTACVAYKGRDQQWDYRQCQPMFKFERISHLIGKADYRVQGYVHEFAQYGGDIDPWEEVAIQSQMHYGQYNSSAQELGYFQFQAYAQIFGLQVYHYPPEKTVVLQNQR